MTGGLPQGARAALTLTSLPDGRVVAAGGYDVVLGSVAYSSALEIYDPSQERWSQTGSLAQRRSSNTTTLLNDGRVLATGGYTSWAGLYLSSCEIHDPKTGTWSATSSLSTTRSGHSASLLRNGNVLVVGGNSGSGNFLASAELFDPATGTWSATGGLAATRSGHTATLLPNGKVLVAGGYNGVYLSTAELYDPATGTWTTTGSMTAARNGNTATLLPNGKVLAAGGNNGAALNSAELYDPATGTWTAINSMATAAYGRSATLLPNGKVMMAGGYNNNPTKSVELYDPATGTWTVAGDLMIARYLSAVTLLPSGKVLVTGGLDGIAMSLAELYDPATGTTKALGSMSYARYGHTATLLPQGKVFIVGGYGVSSPYDTEVCEVFEVSEGGTWTATGSMTSERIHQMQVLLPNGKVLAAGGFGLSGALASAEVFDVATGTWTATANLPVPRGAVTPILLPSGNLLCAGGGGDTRLSSAILFDPVAGTWAPTGSLSVERSGHTTILLPSGMVLVAGGGNNVSNLGSAELYDPSTGIWTSTGSLNTVRRAPLGCLLPNGKVLVVGQSWNAELYNPATGTWTTTSNLNWFRDVGHTVTLLPNGKVLVTGGLDHNSNPTMIAELYDPAAGTWTFTGFLSTPRHGHTATLLANGKVLVAGGNDGSTHLASVEIYDPASGTWTRASSMTSSRSTHQATLLPNGKVLLTGGYVSGVTSQASAELYDPNLGFSEGMRPQITSATFSPTGQLVLSGTGFLGSLGGYSGSGGRNNDSPTNHPVVQLRWLDSGETTFLRPDPTVGFSATSFTSTTGAKTKEGPARVTVFSSGIPSTAAGIASPDIAVAQAGSVVDGGTVNFATLDPGGSDSLTFTITNPGTADLTSLAVTVDGTSAADFTVGALSATSIPTGAGTVTFTVTFAPLTAGNKTAALHIASNVSGAKNPFDINLVGLARPSVTSIAPASGSALGGESVTITGLGFTGATGVTIGGAAATNVTVVNDTTITCTTPGGAAGTASVLVINGGTSAANSLYTFVADLTATYTSATQVPLTVSSLAPAGNNVYLSLGYAPATGTTLTVVKNTGAAFITGQFGNLAQGQTVTLSHGGVDYQFVANYYGGTGNDLVLVWKNNRAFAWGYNSNGQLGDNTLTDRNAPVAVTATGVLAGKTIIAQASGESHSLALCSDGTVAAWGYNGAGQLGDNTTTNRSVPVAVNTASGTSALFGKTVVAIAAGATHSLALCSDGTVAAWGSNGNGRLGDNTTTQRNAPVAVNTVSGTSALFGKTVVAVAAGFYHSLALCSDSSAVAWGRNDRGQLGDTTTTQRNVPVAVNNSALLAGERFAAMASGSYANHSLAVVSVPPLPPTVGLPTVASVTASTATLGGTVLLDGEQTITARGVVYAKTSQNPNPQIGGANVTVLNHATNSSGLFTVDATGLEPGTSYAFTAFATNALGTGYSSVGSFETAIDSASVTYTAATDAPFTLTNPQLLGGAVTLALGYAPAAGTSLTVVKNTGPAFITGQFGNLAQGQTVTLTYGGVNYQFVANYYGGTGNDLVLVWKNSRALAWGYNSFGQLGDNSGTNRPAPVAVTATGVLAGKTIVSLASGNAHSLALCSDGTVAAWGRNDFGQLGDNTAMQSNAPVAVNTASGTSALYGKTVVAIAAGGYHSLALCSDGTVAAWGYNGYGQLGDITTTQRNAPVAVNTVSGTSALFGKTVVALAAGFYHSLALCSDGTAAGWGWNGVGQLGDNTATNRSVPVAVNTASGTSALFGKSVVALATGQYHSLALCSDGSLVAWGYNDNGQLGDNTTTNRSVPVAVNTASGTSALFGKTVTAIATGFYHSLALCSDGSLAAWGANSYGQLGDNTTSRRTVPVAVNTASGTSTLYGKTVVAITLGQDHSLALCSDGSVSAWGRNDRGQLGDNTTTNRNVPVDVNSTALVAGERFSALATGASAAHSLALASVPPAPPTISAITPNFGSTAGGTAVTITGTNFTGATGVTIGGAAATNVTVVNATTITCTTPAGTGTASVQVIHPDGTNAANTLFAYNATPTDITLTPASLAENNAPGATVGTLAAVDADAGDAHTFSFVTGTGDDDNASFSLSGSTLSLNPSANFESKTSYSLRVQANDGNGGTFAKALTVTITNVNEMPTDIALGTSSIAENNAANATVGTLSTTDPDAGDTFTYSFATGGADNASFSLVGDALKLTSAADFETKSSYAVKIRSTDAGGLFFEKDFTVTITNVNEAPADIALSSSSLAENNAPNAIVGSLAAVDPDAGATHSFSLVAGTGSSDNTSFNISGSNLVLIPSANFETKSSYSLRVQASDGQGGLFAKALTVTITDVNEAPTDITLSSSTIAENNAANATVGTLAALGDPDAGATHAFSFVAGAGDTDNASFSLSGSNLILAPSANFEVKSSYSLRVQASDGLGGTFAKAFTVTITDVNEAPTDITLTPASIAEGNAANAMVGTLAAIDADAGATHTFSLVSGTGDTDNASFTIAGNALKIIPVTDFEPKSSYSLRVQANDGAGGIFAKALTVTITNVNEAPTDILFGSGTLAENNAVNASVGTLTATGDLDIGATHTYSLVSGTGSTDNASFTIASNVLRIVTVADFETKSSYSVRVQASDGLGGTFAKALTITITNVNEAPTDIMLTPTSIAENNAVNATVGTLAALGDPDAGATHSFSLVTGTGSTDNASFTISGSNLILAPSTNFEVKSSYSLRVQASDGLGGTFAKALTVSITNVNEAPTNLTLSASSIAENNAANATVGTLAATGDPDAGATHTFSLVSGTGDTDNASFSITGTTLSLATVADFETKSSYSVRVQASDGTGGTFAKAFTVTITDANEAPTDITLSNSSVVETNATGATIGTLAATGDPDAGASHTFSLVSGTGDTDNASFSITGTTLSLATVVDYETKSSYSVRVQASDGAFGTIFAKAFTISVINVNEAPSFTLPAGVLVPAGGSWSARESSRSWYSIASSADGTKLAAVSNGGQIYISANSGATWTARESSRGWTSIAMSADGTKLAAVVRIGQIYTSTDSGVTWTARATSQPWVTIASSADGTKLAAVVYGGQIHTSSDSGVTWTARESTRNWNSIASSSDGTKLAAVVQSGQIYTSTDSGVTWVARESNRNWSSIASSSDGSRLAATAEGGFVYTSTDGGVSWTARGSGRSWRAIASSTDGTRLAAAASSSQLFTSIDGGISWTARENNRSWFAIASSADGLKLAAGVFGGQIYTSVGSFTPYNLMVDAGSGTSTTASFATSISPGPANESAQTVSFTVTNSSNALFTTQPAIATNGTLTFTPGNTTGVATVTVVAVDDGGTANGGIDTSAAQTFTITINNSAPTNVSLSATSIAENNAANATIGTLSTTDPNGGDTFTYSLNNIFGYDQSSFTIEGSTLKLTPSADFESKSSYTIAIRSTDSGGLSVSRTFTITITNVNEAPTSLDLAGSFLMENNPPNQTVGSFSTADPDTGSTFTYSFASGGADNASFTIADNILKLTPSADYETKSTYAIKIRSTDGGGLFIEQDFEVSIGDVTLPQSIDFAFYGPKVYGDAPFTVSATGGPSGQPVTFTVSGPATISGNTVTLTGTGTVTITAHQAAGNDYGEAPEVAQSFTVQSAFTAWAIANGLPTDPNANGGVNLQRFAFGLDPNGTGTSPVVINGSGDLVNDGFPTVNIQKSASNFTYNALFTRRKDWAAIGLTFTVQFSGDMVTWVNSTGAKTPIASDADSEAVIVRYPFFVNGKKALFFRVVVGTP